MKFYFEPAAWLSENSGILWCVVHWDAGGSIHRALEGIKQTAAVAVAEGEDGYRHGTYRFPGSVSPQTAHPGAGFQ